LNIGRQDFQPGRQAVNQAGIQVGEQPERQPGRQTDRQAAARASCLAVWQLASQPVSLASSYKCL